MKNTKQAASKTEIAKPAGAKDAAPKNGSATNAATSDAGVGKVVVPYEDDLAYIEDELRWIRARCERIGAGNLARTPKSKRATLQRSFMDDDINPRAQALLEARLRVVEQACRAEIDARLQVSRQSGRVLALDAVCTTYALDDFERTVLLLAVAPAFSRDFREVYENIDAAGASGCLDVETAFQFYELSYSERIRRRSTFAPGSRLGRNDLLSTEIHGRYTGPEDLLSASLNISQQIFQYLIGEPDLGDEFLEFSSIEEPRVELDCVVLPAEDRSRILSVVDRHADYLACRKEWGFDEVIRYGRGVLMLFYGKPGTGKTMTAHGVAKHLGRRVLNVDIPAFLENREADRFLPGLFREARLQNALLFFDECEVLFESRRRGNALMTLLLTELERFEGVAVLATNMPNVLDEALDRRILVKVRFDEPDRQARAEIWRKHLPPQAPLAADVDLAALADRFEMTGGYIKNAVLMAVAAAVHTVEGQPRVITMAMLEQAAKDQLRRTGDDRHDLVQPKVRLTDVILAANLLASVEELIDAARHRRSVLERWGIGSHLSAGKGVAALLSGPPGTGKTLCAEAIAAELNRPLLLAQLPALLSRWVGGTEQNLGRLFADARAEGAVLLLDEADALLTDRDSLEHKHDVSVVNVLLTLIERHDGVVLLASNRPARLDKALARRLGWHLAFTEPDAWLRSRIWQSLLPATVPTRGTIAFDRLGRNFPLVGGHIKNAVFKAAFRAARLEQPLTQAMLEEAAQEEWAAITGEDPEMLLFATGDVVEG